jgi:hypothetical protein
LPRARYGSPTIALGQNEPCHSLRWHGRSTSDCISFPEEATHPRYYGEGYPARRNKKPARDVLRSGHSLAGDARDRSRCGSDGAGRDRRSVALSKPPRVGVSRSRTLESSTGDTVNRGGITKAGNGRARRILVEAAWSYRHPPRVSREKQIEVAAAPRAVREIAWKAQMRLCGRFRSLTRKGSGRPSSPRRSPASWRPSSGRSIARSWDLMRRRTSSPGSWTARAMKGSTGPQPLRLQT